MSLWDAMYDDLLDKYNKLVDDYNQLLKAYKTAQRYAKLWSRFEEALKNVDMPEAQDLYNRMRDARDNAHLPRL